jgi:hypothetical protein
MRWPWRRQGRKVEPRPIGKPGPRSLETAKEILMEVFHTRPSEVEEMSHEATVHGENRLNQMEVRPRETKRMIAFATTSIKTIIVGKG